MPLHVKLSINNQVIDRIHIARMEPLGDHDAVYKYRVVEGNMAHELIRYEEGTLFEHRYSDGAHRCVERALEALRTSVARA